MRFDIAAPLLAAVPLAAAHGAVTSYIVDGKTFQGYDGFAPMNTPSTIQFPWPGASPRASHASNFPGCLLNDSPPPFPISCLSGTPGRSSVEQKLTAFLSAFLPDKHLDYNPIMQASSPKMTCNGGTKAQLSAPIEAGKNITAVWKQWTHEQGPVMVWLYKCKGEFAGCTGQGKGWFKIDQMGLYGKVLNSNQWGTGVVYKTKEWSSVIPKNIAPGNYLIRHELIALHQANTPQFYPECAQIVISGSGTALPPENYTFTIPTYAPQSDPGITVSFQQPSCNVRAIRKLLLRPPPRTIRREVRIQSSLLILLLLGRCVHGQGHHVQLPCRPGLGWF